MEEAIGASSVQTDRKEVLLLQLSSQREKCFLYYGARSVLTVCGS